MKPASSDGARVTDPKSLLCFAPYGNWRVHHQLDAVVAAAMRRRGHKTVYISCDRQYEHCALFRQERRCDVCESVAAETIAPFGLEAVMLGSLIEKEDRARAQDWVTKLADDALLDATYRGLPVGEWAISTVMTTFRISSTQQLDAPEIRSVHRVFLRDTLITYWAILRTLEREAIDCLFLFNARFYPYRAAYEAANSRGIRILVHERGRTANTFTFFEGETCLGVETCRRLSLDWSSVPLADSELRRLDAFFSPRRYGHNTNWPTFYERMQEADVYRSLDIPRDARLVGFFTSSSDEIGSSTEYQNVNNQFELIENVAAILAESNTYLVVRHHPHMGGAGDSPVEVTGFYESYRRAVGRRPNVRIVMPRDGVTSYALFPFITAAIAPFSTIGMETTGQGIPTLVAKESAYVFDADYALDAWSGEGLEAKIKFLISPRGQLTDRHLRRFFRRTYADLYRFSVAFDVVGIKDFVLPAPHSETSATVGPGRDVALDRVCAFLSDGKPTHARPGMQAFFASTADEDRHVEHKLEAFASRLRHRDAPARVEADVSLCVMIEETIEGRGQPTSLDDLPHADKIRTVLFQPKKGPLASRLLQAGLDRVGYRRTDETFDAWRRGLRLILSHVREDYVLVTSRRFQFHDASIDALMAKLELVGKSASVVPLAGWFGGPRGGRPLYLKCSALEASDWRDLKSQTSGVLHAKDLLSLVLVKRDWLWDRLRSSSAHLENSVLDEARTSDEQARVDEPIFLWQ